MNNPTGDEELHEHLSNMIFIAQHFQPMLKRQHFRWLHKQCWLSWIRQQHHGGRTRHTDNFNILKDAINDNQGHLNSTSNRLKSIDQLGVNLFTNPNFDTNTSG